MTELPVGWRRVRLEEVAAVTMGQSPPGSSYNERGEGLPFFQGKAEFTATYPTIHKFTTAGTKVAGHDDVLVSVRAPVGPSNLAPADCVVGRGLAALRGRPDIDQRFLLWAIRATESELARQGAGSTFAAITGRQLRDHRINVAPLEEQRRIVEILEDHLSRLDAANRYVASSRRSLDRLEQVVLSKAYRTSRDLVQLGTVAEIQGGIQKQPKRSPRHNHYPFLRVANVTSDGLQLSEVHRIELFGNEIDRYRLQRGDLLVVEGNGSASQIGRAALWDGSIPDCVHQNHLIRVRVGPDLNPSFLEAIWNSPDNRRRLSELASSTSGLHTLSVAKLKNLPVPRPNPDAQARAIDHVEQLREGRARLAGQLAHLQARSGTLRRELLQAAFTGRLSDASSDVDRVEELAGV